jgi:hypothetical protein
VLRDRRPGDRQLGGELADRARPAGQKLDDRLPGGVTQRRERRCSVSCHER